MRYFAKRCGVTMLTRASVHCADRIVATTSSSALWWWSAQVASGYSRFSRAMIFRARALRSAAATFVFIGRSEEHTSELQSRLHLVCRLLLEKKKKILTNLNTT